MRRIILAVTVLGAAFAATPARAASVTIINNVQFHASFFNPSTGDFVYILPCSTYREEVVGGSVVSTAYCNAVVSNGLMTVFGQGQLTLEFDPLLLTGTAKGVLGQIDVDLSFLASRVTTEIPDAAVEVVPTPPQEVNGDLALARRGRVNGTVKALPQIPSVPVVNALSNVSRTTNVMTNV